MAKVMIPSSPRRCPARPARGRGVLVDADPAGPGGQQPIGAGRHHRALPRRLHHKQVGAAGLSQVLPGHGHRRSRRWNWGSATSGSTPSNTGFVETPMTASATPAFLAASLSQTPLSRAGHPEEAAALVTFLLSDAAHSSPARKSPSTAANSATAATRPSPMPSASRPDTKPQIRPLQPHFGEHRPRRSAPRRWRSPRRRTVRDPIRDVVARRRGAAPQPPHRACATADPATLVVDPSLGAALSDSAPTYAGAENPKAVLSGLAVARPRTPTSPRPPRPRGRLDCGCSPLSHTARASCNRNGPRAYTSTQPRPAPLNTVAATPGRACAR